MEKNFVGKSKETTIGKNKGGEKIKKQENDLDYYKERAKTALEKINFIDKEPLNLKNLNKFQYMAIEILAKNQIANKNIYKLIISKKDMDNNEYEKIKAWADGKGKNVDVYVFLNDIYSI